MLKFLGMSLRGRGVANRWKYRQYGRRQPNQKERAMQPPNQTDEIKVIANIQRREKRAQIAADQTERDSIAWEMHQSGVTWEKVAEAIGFANGAIARRAALRYRQRTEVVIGMSEPQA